MHLVLLSAFFDIWEMGSLLYWYADSLFLFFAYRNYLAVPPRVFLSLEIFLTFNCMNIVRIVLSLALLDSLFLLAESCHQKSIPLALVDVQSVFARCHRHLICNKPSQLHWFTVPLLKHSLFKEQR